MPAEFVLELRHVTSLTEARFAAGEMFTHIRLSAELAGGETKDVQDIKDWLSGVHVGLELAEGQIVPDWADYYVQESELVEGVERISLVPPGSEGDMSHCIVLVEDLDREVPQGFSHPLGLSFPSPGEYKTGYSDFDQLQDRIEQAREIYGF